MDKLPTKGFRWLLFTGLGLGADLFGAGGLGKAIGVGIGAVDTFLLDSTLHKGWRPNQFVESSLIPFVER